MIGPPPTIGVLALQGAYEAHVAMLRQLGATAVLIRKPEELAPLDGLIIPGGESSTFLKHLERAGFFDALSAFTKHKPTFGTCAGAILLARDVTNPPQRSLAAMDIEVERNFYGRQNDSVILSAETTLPGGPLEMVYIRAPRIAHAGPGVEIIARRDNDPALVREGNLLAATFHPELGHDLRIHQLFLDMVAESDAT